MKQQSMWHRGSGVLFGHMYEDVNIELSLYPAGGRVCVVASAGCTALRLAEDFQVVAVDINPAQLQYAQSRAGGAPPLYGSAERLLSFGRGAMAAAGWTRTRLLEFTRLNNCENQLLFWKQHLDNFRFRRLFDGGIAAAALLVRTLTPRFAFPPPEHFGVLLRSRMERTFAQYPNRQNPYVQRLLTGSSAAPETAAHKQRNIQFVHADMASYLEQVPRGSFDAFSLSNIVDGATPAFRERLFAAVRHAARDGALVVLRSFRETSLVELRNRAAQDRSLLWGAIYAGPVGGLPDAFPG